MFLQSGELRLLEKTIHLMDKLKEDCDFSGSLLLLKGLRNRLNTDFTDAAEPLEDIVHWLHRNKEEL